MVRTPCTFVCKSNNALPVGAHVPAITGYHRECGRVVQVVSCLSIKTAYLRFSRLVHFLWIFSTQVLEGVHSDEAEHKCGKAVVKQVKDILIVHCNSSDKIWGACMKEGW